MDDTTEGKQKELRRKIRPEEIEASMKGPAVYSNRVFAAISPAGLRISFTEQASQEAIPIFRAAVLLPIQEAISFMQLLERMLENYLELPVEEYLDPSDGPVKK